MFILKFANGVKTGHAPTDHNPFSLIPTLRVLHTYTPLPLPTTPSGRLFFYSIQVPYLLFEFGYARVTPFSPLSFLPSPLLFSPFPYSVPLPRSLPYLLPLPSPRTRFSGPRRCIQRFRAGAARTSSQF